MFLLAVNIGKRLVYSRRRSEAPLLSFLYRILKYSLYPNYLTWKDAGNGIFRINDAESLAKLWGEQRGYLNMTYEKMSRGLRHYYTLNLLRKVNIRGCYQ